MMCRWRSKGHNQIHNPIQTGPLKASSFGQPKGKPTGPTCTDLEKPCESKWKAERGGFAQTRAAARLARGSNRGIGRLKEHRTLRSSFGKKVLKELIRRFRIRDQVINGEQSQFKIGMSVTNVIKSFRRSK